VPPLYASGSDFLKESYGYFNELLLFDHLRQTETDLQRRAVYLDRFFERAFQIFSQAWTTDFEQALYEKVAQGELATAENLNALMARTGARYSIWFELDDDAKRDWINIPHYFRNPFYRVNYLYARLLALKYYGLYKRDPKAFAAGYLALQRNGYDAAPDVLLKRFLGVELRGNRFVSDILDILKDRMREMETLYSNN
jgi:oligoendopeptidase F